MTVSAQAASHLFPLLPVEILLPIVQSSKSSRVVCVYDLRTGQAVPLEGVSKEQQITLRSAHMIAEEWFAWLKFSWLDKTCRMIAQIEMLRLGNKVVRAIEELDCVQECASRGWFLDVWKIYFYYKWEKLKTCPSILHWNINTEFDVQSRAFVFFLLDINQKYSLGLLDAKDKDGYLPIHSVCHIVNPAENQKKMLCQIVQKMAKSDPRARTHVRALVARRIYPVLVNVNAIFLAAFAKNFDIIPELLRMGADLEQENDSDETAFQLLQEFAPKNSPAPDYLLSLGAEFRLPIPRACRDQPAATERKNPTLLSWLSSFIFGR